MENVCVFVIKKDAKLYLFSRFTLENLKIIVIAMEALMTEPYLLPFHCILWSFFFGTKSP